MDCTSLDHHHLLSPLQNIWSLILHRKWMHGGDDDNDDE